MKYNGGTTGAEVITVIHTTEVCGKGDQEDPVREIDRYWSTDGKFLAEFDPMHDKQPPGYVTARSLREYT